MPVDTDVYYYHAHFGFDDNGFEERDEYGFVIANGFKHAMSKIHDYYRDDLMSVQIEYIGDTGMVCINNKAVAEVFKASYTKTHYGEE